MTFANNIARFLRILTRCGNLVRVTIRGREGKSFFFSCVENTDFTSEFLRSRSSSIKKHRSVGEWILRLVLVDHDRMLLGVRNEQFKKRHRLTICLRSVTTREREIALLHCRYLELDLCCDTCQQFLAISFDKTRNSAVLDVSRGDQDPCQNGYRLSSTGSGPGRTVRRIFLHSSVRTLRCFGYTTVYTIPETF